MEFLLNPEALVALATLTALEIVLGIDNVIFIAVVAGRLPEGQRDRARRLGIAVAVVGRVLLLVGITGVMRLTEPLVATMALTPASSSTCTPSAKGKKLSLEATAPRGS